MSLVCEKIRGAFQNTSNGVYDKPLDSGVFQQQIWWVGKIKCGNCVFLSSLIIKYGNFLGLCKFFHQIHGDLLSSAMFPSRVLRQGAENPKERIAPAPPALVFTQWTPNQLLQDVTKRLNLPFWKPNNNISLWYLKNHWIILGSELGFKIGMIGTTTSVPSRMVSQILTMVMWVMADMNWMATFPDFSQSGSPVQYWDQTGSLGPFLENSILGQRILLAASPHPHKNWTLD